MREIIEQCCEPFAGLLAQQPALALRQVREIRIRVGQPVYLIGEREQAALRGGAIFRPTQEEVGALLRSFCRQSPYAHEEQIAQGYLTLRGGHRVGLCGHAVVREGKLLRMDAIQAMNIRVARPISCAATVLPFLLLGRGVRNTLVVSPPGMGKTTLLRDLAAQLSARGSQVALVDERGELAGLHRGAPQLNVGSRTDVMENCPKAEAIPLLVRAMSPDVLITDEVGGAPDLAALAEAVRCGVTVIASAHGSSVADIRSRPALQTLARSVVFDRFVVLGLSPGHVCGVYDGEGKLCRCAS